MTDAYPSSIGGDDDVDMDDVASLGHVDGLAEDEDRYGVFMPAVAALVGALGGYEDVRTPTGAIETVYRPGDSVLAVLKDLKKLWRKDDADDERTVARCMAKAGLMKELVALVGECTARGDWGKKIALMACDLIAALTWPIDVAQELKEMQDEGEVVTDYASLLRAQVEYKAMIIHSDTLRCILSLILPFLAKPRREEREERIVSLGLHIVRNLLAIKDVVADGNAIGEKEELSTLQSSLVLQLDQLTYFQLILTMASAADKTAFNPFNVLVLDILHLIFRGVSVHALGQDQARAPIENLAKLLDGEKRRKATVRNGMSRHSRFGTTITVQAGDQKVILHKQNAISANAAQVLDSAKRKRAAKHRRHDELTVNANLSPDAIAALQQLAKSFIQSCFNTFISSILRDIRMERSKIRPKDSVRALFVSRFCIEYLLLLRQKFMKAGSVPGDDLALGLVAEMAEVDSVRWVVLRMKLTMDDKPPAWTELQASIDCFTQILLLIDSMSQNKDEEEVEVAEILQNQLYYNGDILDACLAVVTQYKDQSISYLGSVVHFAYVLLRMLERYSKTKAFMFVRRRRAARKRRQAAQQLSSEDQAPIPEEYREEDDEGVPDHEAPSFAEHAFTFESFEKRFAQENVVHTLLTYLARYRDFDEPEQMKHVVSLMHRQVVRTQAEGLYFKVSVLHLFRSILDDQATLPPDDNTKNLLQLVTFVLRKFFKRVDQDPFLIIEALAPKGGRRWKELSSYKSDDEDGMGGQEARIKEKMGPAELEFKKNKKLSWSQQMGIVVSVLVKAGHDGWIKWIIEVLEIALAAKQEVVAAVDGEADLRAEDSDGERVTRNFAGPSSAAVEKFARHDLDADTDTRKEATTKNSHFRLMLKLLSFDIESTDVARWFLPAAVMPQAIQTYLGALAQFLAAPPDVDDAGALLRKARAPRPRRQRGSSRSGSGSDTDAAPRPPRKKKAAETQAFKSAAFIDDSDDDADADAAFFAREAQLRAEMQAVAETSGSTMRVTGTKRKRVPKGKGKAEASEAVDSQDERVEEPAGLDSDGSDVDVNASMNGDEDDDSLAGTQAATQRLRRRVIESDDE